MRKNAVWFPQITKSGELVVTTELWASGLHPEIPGASATGAAASSSTIFLRRTAHLAHSLTSFPNGLQAVDNGHQQSFFRIPPGSRHGCGGKNDIFAGLNCLKVEVQL